MKKILITNFRIKSYTGSEINILSLSRYFIKIGWDVTCVTLECEDPLRKEFQEEKIQVLCLDKEEDKEMIRDQHYDYIWCQHHVLLDYILLHLNVTGDKILFSSLSPYEPLEGVPEYADDLSLILANSQETADMLNKEGVSQDKIYVMLNHVTEGMINWGAKKAGKNGKLSKIAVISNHIEEDVYQAMDLLEKGGITIDYYGQQHRQVLINEEVLSQYDLIVTIGKTVQFAMSMKIPVYVYDHFGGPGYLRKDLLDNHGENLFEKAVYYNFSGRGFEKKDAEIMAEEILSNYGEACDHLEELYDFICEECDLSKQIKSIMKIVYEEEKVACDKIIEEHRHLKRNSAAFLKSVMNEHHYETKIQWLEPELFKYKDKYNEAKYYSKAYKKEAAEWKREYMTIKNAAMWKITAPVRKILDRFS